MKLHKTAHWILWGFMAPTATATLILGILALKSQGALVPHPWIVSEPVAYGFFGWTISVGALSCLLDTIAAGKLKGPFWVVASTILTLGALPAILVLLALWGAVLTLQDHVFCRRR